MRRLIYCFFALLAILLVIIIAKLISNHKITKIKELEAKFGYFEIRDAIIKRNKQMQKGVETINELYDCLQFIGGDLLSDFLRKNDKVIIINTDSIYFYSNSIFNKERSLANDEVTNIVKPKFRDEIYVSFSNMVMPKDTIIFRTKGEENSQKIELEIKKIFNNEINRFVNENKNYYMYNHWVFVKIYYDKNCDNYNVQIMRKVDNKQHQLIFKSFLNCIRLMDTMKIEKAIVKINLPIYSETPPPNSLIIK